MKNTKRYVNNCYWLFLQFDFLEQQHIDHVRGEELRKSIIQRDEDRLSEYLQKR